MPNGQYVGADGRRHKVHAVFVDYERIDDMDSDTAIEPGHPDFALARKCKGVEG